MNADELCETIEGLPTTDAQLRVEKAGLLFRIASVDDVPRVLTRDYKPNRITVTIHRGVVTRASKG